ncbi:MULTISPECIES: YdeI/OmpD-associated family protein [Streptomycetaceae]|uniref:YdeI/OmpD-associated family protein n=1 Tax=Streptomycetaceae TaxID=2062 RepID=UPI0030087D2F
MKFRTQVEPPEPMRGLEVPPEIVEELGGGARPPVTITVNGHTWRSRLAIMRGRHLIGFSKANRAAAGVDTGEEVEVELALDTAPRTVTEPEDFAAALKADPVAATAYNSLTPSRKREHIRAVESAKKPETRARRIAKALLTLREQDLS